MRCFESIQLAIKNSTVNRAVHLLLLTAVTAVCMANGQQMPMQSQGPAHPTDSTTLQRAISKVEKGNFDAVDVAIITRSHAVQAIPALETQFELIKDPTTKARIADALVRLGETNGPYWDFMTNRARHILQDVPPTPFEYDASGRAASTGYPKRLTEWATKHHVSAQQAWQYAMFEAPGAIMVFGIYDDDRAIPILREALGSENDLVKAAAALGLAELHDTASIPAIIQVCENSPKEAASSIAESLVYFNDRAAQRAVDTYLPKSTAQELREAVAHGKTPYH